MEISLEKFLPKNFNGIFFGLNWIDKFIELLYFSGAKRSPINDKPDMNHWLIENKVK